MHNLVSDLKKLGVQEGDTIIVHSSLSSIGWVEGGPNAVIGAIVEAVGQDGTVLFPTLTGTSIDSAAHPPNFDAKLSPAQTGLIPETARLRLDAIRSLHPTHSVAAIGKRAAWITIEHELCRTPCGFGSPYDKLSDIGGKILLIGVTEAVNTCFHHSEELAKVPFVLQTEPVNAISIDFEGNRRQLNGIFIHSWESPRDYDRLEPQMIENGMISLGKLGDANCRLVDASAQRKFLLNLLLEDPSAVLRQG